jgi:hypothetical protein
LVLIEPHPVEATPAAISPTSSDPAALVALIDPFLAG